MVVIELPKCSLNCYLTNKKICLSEQAYGSQLVTAPYLFVCLSQPIRSGLLPMTRLLYHLVSNSLTWVITRLQLTITHASENQPISDVNGLKSHLSFFTKDYKVNVFLFLFLNRWITSVFTIKSLVNLTSSWEREIGVGRDKRKGGELRSCCNRICGNLLEFEVK